MHDDDNDSTKGFATNGCHHDAAFFSFRCAHILFFFHSYYYHYLFFIYPSIKLCTTVLLPASLSPSPWSIQPHNIMKIMNSNSLSDIRFHNCAESRLCKRIILIARPTSGAVIHMRPHSLAPLLRYVWIIKITWCRFILCQWMVPCVLSACTLHPPPTKLYMYTIYSPLLLSLGIGKGISSNNSIPKWSLFYYLFLRGLRYCHIPRSPT